MVLISVALFGHYPLPLEVISDEKSINNSSIMIAN